MYSMHACMHACMYVCINIYMYTSRRKFRSQTSDNMDRWKAEQGRGREKRKIRRKKSKKKEDADARKGRKVAKHCVFPMICGSGGSKSRLAKAAGAEPAGQMRDEKLHAVVARSTFPSQNVQNTSAPDHFWQLRCWKSARRCGAKHISKSKCTKHTILGPLLKVEMSKKCTPLWREAHFQVKMYKTHQVRTTFGSWDVEKVHAVVERSTFPSQNVWREAHFEVKMYKTLGVRTTFGGSDVASLRFGSLHYTIHYTTLQYITLHYTPQHYNYRTTQLHSTTLNYTRLHHITLHSTTLHYITLHYTHYTTLQYITLHYTPQHYNYNYRTTQLHYTPLHYTPLH